MNVEDLTIGQARELSRLFAASEEVEGPFEVGQQLLIRCVTHYWTGRVAGVYRQEIVLEEAAWIADSGRYAESLRNGVESLDEAEIEPVEGPVIIGRGAIVDAAPYSQQLPRKVK